MRNVQQMIGLPVYLKDGKLVGRIQDFGFDEFWQVACVVLDTKVWFRQAVRIVKWSDVTVIGDDALFIRDRSAVSTIERKHLLRSFHTGLIRLKELPVYTVDGQELGRVSDVYFGKSQGTQIVGYELTDGFLADVFEGRRRLLLPQGPEGVTLGEDAILVPASCERVLEREPYAESDR
ncbi:PRC-barrel domain-containing protein [Cohnella thermotolerans]|uniref:PRC-barrel domain-containing protein n=1 Tax=Cohnella thermotolerans TaxID=329858 RepID=UPI00042025C5|nr:PRC-barrel domain-containing protein [Cohnella thermotolerans]